MCTKRNKHIDFRLSIQLILYPKKALKHKHKIINNTQNNKKQYRNKINRKEIYECVSYFLQNPN
ncbi:hypothetical protein BANORC5_09820 [Bacteroides nordii]|nr:hypothetical protein BANORC5_09820 [Bacteroides nordii]